MGMSAWGLLAAPLMAHGPAPATIIEAPVAAAPAAEAGLFDGLAAMDDGSMSEASGGSDTAIDIGYVGVNIAENKGLIKDNNAAGSTTGGINDIAVNGNGGITTVFFNTGNGVIFQSSVNVNIFANSSGPQ